MSADVITKKVVKSYLGTLIWSETLSLPDGQKTLEWEGATYSDGTSLQDLLDPSDLPDEIVETATADLESFRESCMNDLGIDPFRWFDAEQVAHDFCLSRNGHGAGFFDDPYTIRAEGPGTVVHQPRSLSQELQKLAKYEGTHGLTVWVEGEGDDAELKVEEHS